MGTEIKPEAMFGVIVYIGMCAGASGLLTLLWALIRPIQDRGEMRSWRVWLAVFAICNLLPYGVFETLTATVGSEMKIGVERALADSEVDGELAYYKVLFYNGTTADVVVVAEEKSVWGMDRPVLRVKMTKTDNGWEPTETNIVYSDALSKDGLVIPPYW